MAIAETAVAQTAVAENPGGFVCELQPAFFPGLADRAADMTFKHLGETVCYRPVTGGQQYISAMIDQTIGDVDGGLARLSQIEYEISVKSKDVQIPRRGDVVVSIGGNYRVETIIETNDPLEWIVTARKMI